MSKLPSPLTPAEYFEAVLNSTVEGVWTIGLDGLIKTVNASAIRMFGYKSADEMIGRNSHELVHHKHADGSPYNQLDCPIYKAFQKGEAVHLEDEALWRADGSSFFADYRSVPIFKGGIEDGTIIGAVVTFLDNTERRLVQEKLDEANRQASLDKSWLDYVLHQLPVPIYMADPATGQYTFANAAMEKMLGGHIPIRSDREDQANEMVALEAGSQRRMDFSEYPSARVARGEYVEDFQFTWQTKKGDLDVSVTAKEIPAVFGRAATALLTVQNVTPYKAVQEQLEESEAKLTFALQSAQMGTWHIDLTTNRVTCSDSMAALFGVPSIKGDIFAEIERHMHPDDVAEVNRVWQDAVSNNLPYLHEYRIIRPNDGETRWIQSRGSNKLDSAGRAIVLSGTIADVTDQVNARHDLEIVAKRLADEQQKLEAMFARSTIGFALLRAPDLVFEKVNMGFRRLVSEREYIGRAWSEVYHELPNSPLIPIMRKVMESGQSFTTQEMKIRVETDRGFEDRYYDIIYSPIFDSRALVYGILCQTEDVTDRVSARITVEQSQSDLVDILESMNDAFFSVDRNWRVIRANAGLEKLVRVSRDQLIGKDILEVFLPSTAANFVDHRSQFLEAMSTRAPVTFETQYLPFGIWVQVRTFPKSDGGLAVFITDITQSQLAQAALVESEMNFKALAEATPQMIWTADPDGRVDYANSQWYDYTRLSPEETMGDGFASVIHPDDVVNTMTVYEHSIRTKTPLEVEHRFKSGLDGLYRWFLIRALPKVEHGEVKKWYGTITNIHEQKTIVAELAKARDEAERANQTKSAFLANMSHEIRTPLGAIMGFTDLLKDRNLEAKERDQFLDTITRNSKALTRIIDDILDLAKVESGKLEVEQVEFSFFELMEDVLDLFRERTRSLGIFLHTNFAPGVPNRICSDPSRLRQIIINIIGNAVKFTHEGGITIGIHATARPDQQFAFSISVKDTGIGLSEEQQARLFQPFMQADNTTTRKFGGTGLGLALSKRLSNALSGDITIEDCRPNEGCTFLIKFVAGPPLASRSTAETKASFAKTSNLALEGIHILLADDSLDNQFLVKRVLNKNGASVESAVNGLEAFRLGLRGSFDIVLMDIQMPEMDGYEATRALREAGFKKPIIALTAHAMAEERARTLAAGCSGHLTKPLNQPELIETIRSLVSKHRTY